MPSLTTHRQNHLHILFYKAILDLLTSHLCDFIHVKGSRSYSHCSVTQSCNLFLLSVHEVHLEMCKRGFRFAAPAAWSLLCRKSLQANQLHLTCISIESDSHPPNSLVYSNCKVPLPLISTVLSFQPTSTPASS